MFGKYWILVCIINSQIIGQLCTNSFRCFLISIQLVPAWTSNVKLPAAPAISKKSPYKMFISHGIRNLIENGQYR